MEARARYSYWVLMALVALYLGVSCDTLNAGVIDQPNQGQDAPQVTDNAAADTTDPRTGTAMTFSVGANDPQSQALTYAWDDGNAAAGEFTGTGDTVTWETDTPGTYTITVTITDTDGNMTTSSFELTVAEPGAVVITVDAPTGYVGKSTCLTCHGSMIDETEFNNHRHNHKLNPSTDAFIGSWWNGSHTFGDIPMDLTRDGSSYTAMIGNLDYDIIRAMGWGIDKWKQRYVVKIGNSWYITPAQYNVTPDAWVAYHAGDWTVDGPVGPEASFDRRCTGCHTTGYTVEYSAETGEWVKGISEENIQCEACHGPGEAHANGPSASNIVNPEALADTDRQLELCGYCHGRGSSTAELGGKTMGFPLKDGGVSYRPGDTLSQYYTQTTSEGSFWQDGPGGTNYHSKSHHQQYNDMMLSEHHGKVQCWDCHNTHEPEAAFTNSLCTDCHVDKAASQLNDHTQHAADMQCIDCHMPLTAKSAVAYDVRSHVFDIINPQVSLDMLAVTPDKVIPNSCMTGGCHSDYSLDSQADLEAMVADYDDLFGEDQPVLTPAAAGYVGKSTCLTCHGGDIDLAAFNNHRHNHKLNPATDEFIGDWWTGSHTFGDVDMDLTRDGSAFTAMIGNMDYDIIRAMGWGIDKWKQRYVVQIGNSWYITPAQYNVEPDGLVAYHAGDWTADGPVGPEASFDRRCTGCHTTGYNVQFVAETGEWVRGFSEENIQCEACHGPGEAHADAPSASNIINPNSLADADRKVEVCGACHGRGSSMATLGEKTMGYPFSADNMPYLPGTPLADYYTQTTSESNFWQDGPGGANFHAKSHHQQYNEYIQTGHFATGFVTCWTCHNSHEPDAAYTNDICSGCHSGIAGDLAAHTNHNFEIGCIDCHMPYTAKSAVAYDVRSHMFDIISPQTSLDMLLVTPEKVIPNSCINGGCHGDLDITNQSDLEGKIADFEGWWPAFGS